MNQQELTLLDREAKITDLAYKYTNVLTQLAELDLYLSIYVRDQMVVIE